MSGQINILLIDDDEDDRDVFAIALKTARPEAKLVTVANGPRAIEMLIEKSIMPDFIFIDLNMPRMNGKECLAALKKIPALQNIPAIIYTTSSDKKDVEDTRIAGATCFLVKPTSLGALSDVLEQILGHENSSYYIETSA